MFSPFIRTILAMHPSGVWLCDDVYGFADMSGNGNDGTASGGLVAGTSDERPLAFEGTRASTFDGTDDVVDTGLTPLTAADAVASIIVRAKRDSAGEFGRLWHSGFELFFTSTDTLRLEDPDNAVIIEATPANDGTDRFHTYTALIDRDNSTTEVLVDSVSLATGAISAFALGVGSLTISRSATPWHGAIGFVLAFDRLLSDSEHLRIRKASEAGVV